MKQSSRSAVVPARWRRLTRGFLLTAAVLGLTVATVPAASAAPPVPNVGSVRHLDVDVDAKGQVPLGLGLAGAAFRFTAGSTTGTCVTDAAGGCDVDWASDGKVSGSGTTDLRLPAGTYTITQVAEQAVPGLQPKSGSLATVRMCDCYSTFLFWKTPVTGGLDVQNTSLYRDRITAKVVDQVTGAPVRLSVFRLTGPGIASGVLAITNWDGELTFGSLPLTSNYRPGLWTITPVAVDPRYLTTPTTVELSASAPGTEKWNVGTIALAEPAPPEPPAPQTGTGTVRLQPVGPVPPGLDLSGVAFTLTGASGASTCVTDALGACAVDVVPADGTSELPGTGADHIALPAGTYTVEQASAPTGLAPDAEIADLVLCTSATPGQCAADAVAENRSLFHQAVSADVRRDGAPVEGTELTLAGPGYLVQPAAGVAGSAAPAAAWPDYRSAPVTTDEEGVAVWTGWFVPGTWTITATGDEEPISSFTLEAPAETGSVLPWTVLVELPTSEEPDPGVDPVTPSVTDAPSTPGSPTTSGSPSTLGAPSTVGSPSASAPGGAAAGGAATGGAVASGGRAAAPSAAAGRAASPGTDPAPAAGTTAAPRSTAPRSTGSPVVVDGDQVFVADEEPDLQTAGSTELFSPGLVLGVGILFVAVVIAGVMVLRRRSGQV